MGGQATRRWISRAPPRSRISWTKAPHGGRADDAVFDQENAFSGEHLRQRSVLELGLGGAVGRTFDERPADVAVSHQPFDGGNSEGKRHGVGRGLGGIRHGDDDRIAVERNIFETGELLAKGGSTEIDGAIVQSAGHVREVDPFEEAMGLVWRGGEALNANATGPGHGEGAGLERADVAKTEIGQRHAFAGDSEQGAMLGDAKRPDAEGVANDDQLSVSGDQHNVVCTVEPLCDPSEDADPVGLLVLGLELVGERVHDDFGVGVPFQVIVALREQVILEGLVVRKLSIEGEGKPLGLAAMVSLEGLGVGPIVAAARCVADVADGERAVDALHDGFEFLAMIQTKGLGDGADILVGLDERAAIGTKAAHARGELAAILHVQEHAGNQPGDAVDVAANWCQ